MIKQYNIFGKVDEVEFIDNEYKTKHMKQPTNDNQEVLFVAINNGSVSLTDFPHLSGYRTRISNLRLKYGVEFREETIKSKNKRGRNIYYQNHILVDIEKAKSQYNLMTRIKTK